ncbi:MAG: segregation and condensation protein, partial [Kribbellaceae bacterium]|nr:segregation and condensation protein [Kribbellaceae bacterium]
SAVRGVNVDGVMRTLVSRGLVEEAGADTESQATLYRTTSYFLERMGMQSLDDLPELAPYLPEMDDMEEELAAQSAPSAEPETSTDPSTEAEASAAQAAQEAEATTEPEVGSEQDAEDGVLEPAEELEAGGDPELALDVDRAEIPELAEDSGAAVGDESNADDSPDAEESEIGAERVEQPEPDYGSEEHGPEVDGQLEPAEELEAAGDPEVALDVDRAEIPELAEDSGDESDADDSPDAEESEIGAEFAEDVEIESYEETLPESGAEGPGPAAQASYGVDGYVTRPGSNEVGGTRDAGTSGGSWSNRDDD